MEELKRQGIEALKLPNGMEVIFKRLKTERFFASLLVSCGSAYESKRNSGISHLLEHLIGEDGLIKDRRRRPMYRIERTGGDAGFDTREAHTVFQLDTWRTCWRRNLEWFIRMVLEPRFSERDFLREKAVAINEQEEDTNEFEAATLKRFFSGHPVSMPIDGTKKSVGSLTSGRIKRWHKKFYTPDRMKLIVAGDISLKKLTALLEKITPRFPSARAISIKPPSLCFDNKVIRLGGWTKYYFCVFFSIPSAPRDLFFFDFIIDALADISVFGPYWEITRSLGMHEAIGAAVASHFFGRYAKATISSPSQKKIEEAERRLFIWIKKNAEKGLSKDLFRRVYRQRVSSVKENIRLGNGEWFREYLEDLIALELSESADLYFHPDFLGEIAAKKEVDRIFRETIGASCVIFRGSKKREKREGD